MAKNWLVTGFLFAALAVILGAFAAHSLRSHVETGEIDLPFKITPQDLQNFETGARYQMYHAFALMICALLAKFYGDKRCFRIAGWLFIAGIIFFAGSLYLLSTHNIIGLTNWKWLGPITPLGGACFIAGWITLIVGIFKEK